MQTPDQFTKPALKTLTKEVMKRIGEIEGMTIKRGNGRFDDKEFTMKIIFTLNNPKLQSTNQISYKSMRLVHELPDWGFTFKSADETYTMIDYSPRSSKYPIVAERKDGQKFKFSIRQIQYYLKRNDK